MPDGEPNHHREGILATDSSFSASSVLDHGEEKVSEGRIFRQTERKYDDE